MKRALASALILSAISGFGLVGCGETTKDEIKQTTSGPGGTTTTETGTKTTTTGENPPAPGAPGTTTTTTPK